MTLEAVQAVSEHLPPAWQMLVQNHRCPPEAGPLRRTFSPISHDQITSGQRESGRPAEVPRAKRKGRKKVETLGSSGAKKGREGAKGQETGR